MKHDSQACTEQVYALGANMLLYYDEIGDRYQASGTMSAGEIARDKRLLGALPIDDLPAIWGMYCVTCRQP